MNRVLFRIQAFILVAVVVGSVGGRAVSASSGAQEASELADRQGLVDRYCVSCHNDRLETGGFTLESLNLADIGAHPEAWEKVVRKMRAGAMPPRPRPRPDQETYDEFRFWLEDEDGNIIQKNDKPGELVYRRYFRSFGSTARTLARILNTFR